MIGGLLLLSASLLGGGWYLWRWLRAEDPGARVHILLQNGKVRDIERIGANGIHYTLNPSEADFRLGMRGEDEHSRKVFASYAEALRYARERHLACIPSVPLVMATCRASDTRVQVALEKMLDENPDWGRPVLIRRWLGMVLSRREQAPAALRDAYNKAAVYLATGLARGGETPELPADIKSAVSAAGEAFNDPPLGPWASTPEMAHIWHRDRFLADGVAVTDDASAAVVAVLTRTMMADATMADGWEKQMAVVSALVGPPAGVTIDSLVAGLAAVPDAELGGADACAKIREAVVKHSTPDKPANPAPAFAAWAATPEESVLAWLGDMKSWRDPVGALIAAVRSGQLSLEPGPEACFYRRRWFALETLAASNKAPEADKLELTADYVCRWERAFAAGFTEGRSGQVKRLPITTMGCADSGDDWPEVNVAPQFTAEPAPVVYLRMARAYRALGKDLTSALGEAAWKGLRDGQGNLVAADVERRAEILLGLALTGYYEIGFPPPLLPEESAANHSTAAATRWCAELEKDPDVAMDARLLVTLAKNGYGDNACPAVLGVRLEPVEYDWVDKPSVSGPINPRFVPVRYWLASPCPATLMVREIPTPEAFRKRCDGHANVADLYAAFGQRAPQLHAPAHPWWWWALGGLAALTIIGMSIRWWRKRTRRGRWIAAAVMALVFAGVMAVAVFAPPVWLMKWAIVRVIGSTDHMGLLVDRWLGRWTSGRLKGIELMKDPDPQIRYFGAIMYFNDRAEAANDKNKPTAASPAEVGFLRQRLSDEVPEVGWVAWDLLAGSAEEVPFLIDQLGKCATADELQGRLLNLARKQPDDPRVIETARGFATHPRADFRAAVFTCFGIWWKDRPPGFAPECRAGCKDADAKVRAAAARVLGKYGAKEDLPVVLGIWGDPDEQVRMAAFEAIVNRIIKWPAKTSSNPAVDLRWTDPEIEEAVLRYANNSAVTWDERLSVGRRIADPVRSRAWCRGMLSEVEGMPSGKQAPLRRKGSYVNGWTRETARAALVRRWLEAEQDAAWRVDSAFGYIDDLVDMPELCDELAASIMAGADAGRVLALLREKRAKAKPRAPINGLIWSMGKDPRGE